MSFNSSDDDSQQRFALGFLFALIALVVSTVVGTVVYKRGISHAPKAEAAVSAPSATNVPVVVVEETARVIVENGVVKFYFVSGKAEVAAGANEALSNVVKGVAEGKRAVIPASMMQPAVLKSTPAGQATCASRPGRSGGTGRGRRQGRAEEARAISGRRLQCRSSPCGSDSGRLINPVLAKARYGIRCIGLLLFAAEQGSVVFNESSCRRLAQGNDSFNTAGIDLAHDKRSPRKAHGTDLPAPVDALVLVAVLT
jgi:hypothetical protein